MTTEDREMEQVRLIAEYTGLHLVYVGHRKPATVTTLAEVRRPGPNPSGWTDCLPRGAWKQPWAELLSDIDRAAA